jgi:starvation-inducible DNA-binding protein
MLVSNSQSPADSTRPASTTASDCALLEELLVHSIKLRDLYKNARWQTADIQLRSLRILFDDHYKEQLRLVDVLLDRLRTLGGVGCVLAGPLLQDTQFSSVLRGRVSPIRLLHALMDAHDAAVGAARPDANSAHNDEWVPAVSSDDFAVGLVVLVNNAQCLSISDQLIARSNCHGQTTSEDGLR